MNENTTSTEVAFKFKVKLTIKQQTGPQGFRPESGIETNFRFYRNVPITKKNPLRVSE